MTYRAYRALFCARSGKGREVLKFDHLDKTKDFATPGDLQPLTGDGRLVFPGARTNTRPMSDNAVLAAMRRMGIGKDEMTGHGFRAVARTILDEVLGFRPDFIEHQLTHAVRDPNGRLQPNSTPGRASEDDAAMGGLSR